MVKSETYPSFFKVFLPEKSFQKLRIPPAFISYLNRKLPTKVILINRLGSVWQMKVVYREEGVFFMNGWEDLVKDNSLTFGDFIVFQFSGDCAFQFRLFRIDQCEKNDVRSSQTIEKRFPNVNVEDEEGSDQDPTDDDCDFSEEYAMDNDDDFSEDSHYDTSDDDNNGKKKKKPKPKSNCYAMSKPSEDEKENEELARPSFTAVIRLYHLLNHYMLVPANFARISRLMKTKIIKLRMSSGKEWRVKYLEKDDRFRISQGWARFAADNNIKMGDTCSFELIRGDVLKVNISRLSSKN